MSNIRPAGTFDTNYAKDMALNRTRADKFWKYGLFIALLFVPLLVGSGPLGQHILPDQMIGTFVQIAILIIAVQGLNILIGFTGQTSLGHAAFVAVGAYSAAIMVREFGVNPWLSIPLAGLITGLVGLLFGLPSLRVKGFYLAMATLAAQFIIPWVLRYPMEDMTGGTRPLTVPALMIGPFTQYDSQTFDDSVNLTIGNEGESGGIDLEGIVVDVMTVRFSETIGTLPDIELIDPQGDVVVSGDIDINVFTEPTDVEGEERITGFEYVASKHGEYQINIIPTDESETVTAEVTLRQAISFSNEIAIYYVVIPASVFLMLAARNVMRTRTGRAFVSVRDNDLAAELLGINVFTYKLRAFFLGSVYAGIAGALLAFETNSLSLDAFQLNSSIEMLAMLIIGGAGFALGPLFGVSFVRLLTASVIPLIAPPLRETILPSIFPFLDLVNINAAVNPLLFGLALMLFLIIEPRGIAHRWEILKVAWKIRPYSY